MRYAIGIEYDGSGFLGWQRLAEGATVQGAVEQALGFVVDHPLEVVCAGRTDSGVHARCQVAHFDTEAVRTPFALPATVRMRSNGVVPRSSPFGCWWSHTWSDAITLPSECASTSRSC